MSHVNAILAQCYYFTGHNYNHRHMEAQLDVPMMIFVKVYSLNNYFSPSIVSNGPFFLPVILSIQIYILPINVTLDFPQLMPGI